jgi:protein gp37
VTTVQARPTSGAPTFNRTNDNVDWAWFTWNPVTGCLHDCPYCYARDIAERFYPQKFVPTFHEDRLTAPANTKLPSSDDPRSRRVFTCSMADLFGKWVPQAWIDAVFERVRDHQEWEFLFLTKFPQRLAELHWPDNAWVGTTVDQQHRVAIAERAFRGVKAGVKWLSCEPLMEPLRFTSLDMFDLVVIGGASRSTQTPEFWPPLDWVIDLMAQARDAGCKVYLKPNAIGPRTPVPKELPRMHAGEDA